MQKITVHKPSTFFCSSPRIMVLDELKNPFYWHTNTARHINFNLPVGTYYINVPVRKRPVFRPYGNKTYPKLPKSFLRKVRVFEHTNPNKATISLQKHIILADPKFYNHEFKPCMTFTLCHEVFHHKYHAKTPTERNNRFIRDWYERQCDNAARNFMLANGWNPLQVRLACKLLLRSKGRNEAIRQCTTDATNNFRR